MSVVVVGLNQRTVPLGVLERLTVPEADRAKALADLRQREHLAEAAVLSTCHRTEVYAVADRFHGAVQDIRHFLCERSFLPPEDFCDGLYSYYDDAAVSHLFTVAAGLDSVVLGESEILGQVKAAGEQAREEGAAGPVLSGLFRHAVEVGRRSRSETGIGRHVTSLPRAAVALAESRLGGLAGRRILVLGAGDVGESMAVALAGAGAAEIFVANRTWDRAVALAARVGGSSVQLAALPGALSEVDLLLTSTGAAAPVMTVAEVSAALQHRPERPLLIVDVALPRDVDPSVAELPGVTLLDLDDLRAFAEAGMDRRRQEVTRVRAIVDEEVARHFDRGRAREVTPTIAAVRERAEAVRVAELDRFNSRLPALGPAERAAVEALTQAIVSKLLHPPTVRLRSAAGTTRGERLAAALRELFEV